MDESEHESTKSELSDSWMVINENPADQIKDNGTHSEGSDGESVEVIDQEEFDEVLTGETDYDAAQTDEEVHGPKNKKYVHHPNEDVNAALNRLMVIAASIVVGLAVGHYLGYSEEVNDLSTTLKKLQAENFKLKNHICMTLENYGNRIMHIPSTAYPELKYFNENYGVFLTVLLNLTCPHTEAKILELKTSLGDLRQALLNGHISDEELYGRIGKILESRSSDREVIDYMKISDQARQNGVETVTTADKGLSSTFSQIAETVTFKDISSESYPQAESLTVKTQEQSAYKKEILDDITRMNNLEHTPVRVKVEAEALKNDLSEGLIDSLAKSPSKIYEGCQESTDSKGSSVNKEVSNKYMLKHIVKDVVQEITESLLALHHDDIIRDIRNEAKKLMESFPLFKSALLLNMEVTEKLKSHLKYVKDILYSVLEKSLHMSDKGKIDEIFSRVNLHALHLEKAMDSLHLMEVTLNPKGTGTLNVERSNVCTFSDFLNEVFIINHHTTHTMENNIKQSNNPYKENNKYTTNQSPPGSTVENLSPKSTMESNEEIVNLEKLQKIEGDNKFAAELPTHVRPSKYDVRQTHEVKDKNKKKQDHNKKYKKSKPLSVETKQYNEKGERKYKNFKTMKDKHHDQEKKLRKQRHHKEKKSHYKEEKSHYKEEKSHYKEEKSFKNEMYDERKKNSYNMYKWDEDNDYRHSNMSGDWVMEMNRARAESRENEHKSDWLFERAYARKAKRNGKWDMNNWYFQRAEGRKSCRQKSCNEKSKFPYPPPNDSEKEYHDNNNKQHQKQKKYFNPKRWISKAYMTVSKFRF